MGFLDNILRTINYWQEVEPYVEPVPKQPKPPFDWTPHVERFKVQYAETAELKRIAFEASLKEEVNYFLETFEIKRLDRFIFIKWNNGIQTFSLDDFRLSVVNGISSSIKEDYSVLYKCKDNISVTSSWTFLNYSFPYVYTYLKFFYPAQKDTLMICNHQYLVPFGTGKIVAERIERMVEEIIHG